MTRPTRFHSTASRSPAPARTGRLGGNLDTLSTSWPFSALPCLVSRALVLVAVLSLALAGTGPALAQDNGEMAFDEASFGVLEEAGVALIRVERSRGEDGAVSVQVSTADGTATAGSDYTAVTEVLSWADGDGSDRVVQIPILDDADAEGDETVQLTLSNPTGGAVLRQGRGTSVLVILASDGGSGGGGGDDGGGDDGGGDDGGGDGGGNGDARNILKFDQRNFLALESSGTALIVVERSRDEPDTVSVDYTVNPLSAQPGSDYQPVSGTFTWGPNDGSVRTFQIPLVNDDVGEPTEHVELLLSNPTGGGNLDGERSRALLTILDDDRGAAPTDDNRPGELKFGDRSFQVIEGQTTALIRVERSRGARGTVSVEYSTTDGSATDGEDYQGASGVLTWGNNDRSVKTFEVPIFEDDVTEGNETVILELANPTGGASLDTERFVAELDILDNDGSTTLCSDDDTTLCLLSGRFQVEVKWRTAAGDTGRGRMIPQGDASGLVWFFDPSNVEMLVKVLDACSVTGLEGFWVFFAATTNVDFTVEVTDTATGLTKEYSNPVGQAAEPVQDTLTFQTCP